MFVCINVYECVYMFVYIRTNTCELCTRALQQLSSSSSSSLSFSLALNHQNRLSTALVVVVVVIVVVVSLSKISRCLCRPCLPTLFTRFQLIYKYFYFQQQIQAQAIKLCMCVCAYDFKIYFNFK